ncbi:hypothetical protein Tco_0000498 [Tanacetum coccineum]
MHKTPGGRECCKTKDNAERQDFQSRSINQDSTARGKLVLLSHLSKTVEGLKTAGYKVTTAGSRLLLLVKKLMLLVQVNAVRHNLM